MTGQDQPSPPGPRERLFKGVPGSSTWILEVVGVTFEDHQAIIAELKVHDSVKLMKVPIGARGATYVAALNSKGQIFGAVPKEHTRILKSIMDPMVQAIDATVAGFYGGTDAFPVKGVWIRFEASGDILDDHTSDDDEPDRYGGASDEDAKWKIDADDWGVDIGAYPTRDMFEGSRRDD